MLETDFLQAKQAITKVLDALDVTRVVTVDDENAQSISVEKVITAVEVLEESQLLTEIPELGGTVPEDHEILAQKIREIWRGFDAVTQARRGKSIIIIARLIDSKGIDDQADVSMLSELIPESILTSLSPQQWKEQEDHLIQNCTGQCILFLFDQNLSNDGNNDEEGIRIIASLLSMKNSDALICGLLTHTVTPETQHQRWLELSEKYAIPPDRFVVIPKHFLSKSPIIFAQLLKFTALAPVFTKLKQKTKEIIENSAESAAQRIDKVSIYDLDHIVFKISADEGLWEPDMLFRLHSMFHRLRSRELAHEGGTLESIAAQLRKVSGIPGFNDLMPTPSSTWELQHEELYETDDHINRNHLPIELGDIFEQVDGTSTKKYILLTQPCDIMVRINGERQPELHRIPLLEIVPKEEKPRYSVEMPYYISLPTKKWYVKLRGVHFVCAYIVDLCAFNQDGIARMSINDTVPMGIRPALKERYNILQKYWNKKVRKADAFIQTVNNSKTPVELKKKIAEEYNGLLFNDDLFKGNFIESEGRRLIVFNCRRIARLSRTKATGMLMEYTSTLGRPAYDKEFGNA